MRSICLILFLFCSTLVHGQSSLQTEVNADGKKRVKVTVDNLVKMLDMTTANWEKSLIEIGYGAKNIADGTTYLSVGSSIGGGINTIGKCPGLICVLWTDAKNNSTIMDAFYNDIESYFLGYDEGTPVFGFLKDGKQVLIHLTRNSGYEYLFIKYVK